MPSPDVIEDISNSKIKKAKKSKPPKDAISYPPDKSVYLLDIWVTLCSSPITYFILYIPHLEIDGGSVAQSIVRVKDSSVAKTYYCDLKASGSMEEFQRGLE